MWFLTTDVLKNGDYLLTVDERNGTPNALMNLVVDLSPCMEPYEPGILNTRFSPGDERTFGQTLAILIGLFDEDGETYEFDPNGLAEISELNKFDIPTNLYEILYKSTFINTNISLDELSNTLLQLVKLIPSIRLKHPLQRSKFNKLGVSKDRTLADDTILIEYPWLNSDGSKSKEHFINLLSLIEDHPQKLNSVIISNEFEGHLLNFHTAGILHISSLAPILSCCSGRSEVPAHRLYRHLNTLISYVNIRNYALARGDANVE